MDLKKYGKKFQDGKANFFWVSFAFWIGMSLIEWSRYFWPNIQYFLEAEAVYVLILFFYVLIKGMMRTWGMEFPQKTGEILPIIWVIFYVSMILFQPVFHHFGFTQVQVPQEMYRITLEIVGFYGASEVHKIMHLNKANKNKTQITK